MLIKPKNFIIFQLVTVFFGLALITGCSMPEKPDGADVQGMTHLADQLRAHGDDAGAADFYQRALQRNPDDIKARVALAEILEAHGDNINAAGQYRLAVQTKPDDGDLHRDLGRVFIKLNRPVDAKAEYEKALQIDSGDTKALNGLGISLDYLGKHDAAQKIYKDILDDNPDDYAALNNLAHSYVLVGAYGEAIKLLEPHIKDKGATPALRQNLAEAYGMAGMDADAERVGRIDLTPEQVKHNLDYYHAQRAKLSVAPKLYADLGSFATEAMAAARSDQVKTSFAGEVAGLIIATTPEVKIIGGTPVFTLRVTGFARAERLHNFCDRLKKEKIPCKAHGA